MDDRIEAILRESGVLERYGHWKSSGGVVQALPARWGDAWFEGVFPVYLFLANKWATEAGREPQPEDLVEAHRVEMERLKQEYRYFATDESPQCAYLIGASRLMGQPKVILFVTNKRVLFVDNSLMNQVSDPFKASRASVELESDETIIRWLEAKDPFSRHMAPSKTWLTNKRVLAVYHTVDGVFAHTSVPLHEGERLETQADLNGLFLLTDRRLIHLRNNIPISLTASTSVEAKVFPYSDRPTVELVPTKKGFFSFLKFPYELVLSGGPETLRFGIGELQLSAARALQESLAARVRESSSR